MGPENYQRFNRNGCCKLFSYKTNRFAEDRKKWLISIAAARQSAIRERNDRKRWNCFAVKKLHTFNQYHSSQKHLVKRSSSSFSTISPSTTQWRSSAQQSYLSPAFVVFREIVFQQFIRRNYLSIQAVFKKYEKSVQKSSPQSIPDRMQRAVSHTRAYRPHVRCNSPQYSGRSAENTRRTFSSTRACPAYPPL